MVQVDLGYGPDPQLLRGQREPGQYARLHALATGIFHLEKNKQKILRYQQCKLCQ